MKFQSALYICFLMLTWLVTFIVKRPALRRVALLLASYLFYLTLGPAFLLVLLGSSLFNFLWGRLLFGRRQAGVLWTGLAVNILLLIKQTLKLHGYIKSQGKLILVSIMHKGHLTMHKKAALASQFLMSRFFCLRYMKKATWHLRFNTRKWPWRP